MTLIFLVDYFVRWKSNGMILLETDSYNGIWSRKKNYQMKSGKWVSKWVEVISKMKKKNKCKYLDMLNKK